MAVRGAPVIGDDAQHVLTVGFKARESSEFARHLGRCRIGGARHQRADGTAQRPPARAVIANAARHQIAADIGEAEAQGAVVVGTLGDFTRWKLRHEDGNLQGQRPQPHRMLEFGDFQAAILIAEGEQVDLVVGLGQLEP